MPFDTDNFVSRICVANKESDPMNAVKKIVEDAVLDPYSILETFPASGPEEILLYRSDDLTIYRVLTLEGYMYPPHAHGMPVVLGIYNGCQTNYLYKRSLDDPAKIKLTGRIDVSAPRVWVLDGDVIHAVSNNQPQPSAALHVYMGNLGKQKRSLWNFALDGEQQFNNKAYLQMVKRLETAGSRIV
jgi:predicted metal-dependent enzyme (double-stranded beta helix superfamily)